MPAQVQAREHGIGNTPLARFLVGDDVAPPPTEALRAALLSGSTLVRSPNHPDRARLGLDARATAARHLAVKAELLRLLMAWHDLGIEAWVFKGFHLAEFVYPDAGQRPYHDVDLLLRPDDPAPACAAAVDLGWEVVWRSDGPDHLRSARAAGYHGHEIAQLRHPLLDVPIDLHRRLAHNLHNRVPLHRIPARLTEAAWRDAERTVWYGVPLRRPRPVDAVVFGLALNRCWGSDAWQVKPRDYTDLEALATRHGLTRQAVVERARELGVRATVEIYLSRCDPFRRRLLLGTPPWGVVRWWNLRVLRERGPTDLVRGAMAVKEAAQATAWWVRVAPTVARARRLAAQPASLAPWIAREGARSPKVRLLGRGAWRDLRRAVHRHLRLGRVPAERREAVAALAVFPWLLRHGHGVELVTGDGDVTRLRLWLDGAPLTVASPAPGDD
jgi:hypothetical protein